MSGEYDFKRSSAQIETLLDKIPAEGDVAKVYQTTLSLNTIDRRDNKAATQEELDETKKIVTKFREGYIVIIADDRDPPNHYGAIGIGMSDDSNPTTLTAYNDRGDLMAYSIELTMASPTWTVTNKTSGGVYTTTLPINDILTGKIKQATEDHYNEVQNIIGKTDHVILCPKINLSGSIDYGNTTGSITGAILTVEKRFMDGQEYRYYFHILAPNVEGMISHFIIDACVPDQGIENCAFDAYEVDPNRTIAVWNASDRYRYYKQNVWFRFDKAESTSVRISNNFTPDLDVVINLSQIDSVLYIKVIDWDYKQYNSYKLYAFVEMVWKKTGAFQRYTGWLDVSEQYTLTTADALAIN